MEFQNQSDAQLAALVRQGQGEAFAELSARYLGLIRDKARQFEGSFAPEKEDLWQEGLLGLYAAAVSYREGGAAFSTYAGVCVQNRMTSAARKHSSSKNRPLNESVPLEAAGEAASHQGPESLVELREDFQAFCKKMNVSLSPLERRVLALYLSGCSRGEAAQRVGVSFALLRQRPAPGACQAEKILTVMPCCASGGPTGAVQLPPGLDYSRKDKAR